MRLTAVPDGVSDDGVFVDDGVTVGTVLATMGSPSLKKSVSHLLETVTKSN